MRPAAAAVRETPPSSAPTQPDRPVVSASRPNAAPYGRQTCPAASAGSRCNVPSRNATRSTSSRMSSSCGEGPVNTAPQLRKVASACFRNVFVERKVLTPAPPSAQSPPAPDTMRSLPAPSSSRFSPAPPTAHRSRRSREAYRRRRGCRHRYGRFGAGCDAGSTMKLLLLRRRTELLTKPENNTLGWTSGSAAKVKVDMRSVSGLAAPHSISF